MPGRSCHKGGKGEADAFQEFPPTGTTVPILCGSQIQSINSYVNRHSGVTSHDDDWVPGRSCELAARIRRTANRYGSRAVSNPITNSEPFFTIRRQACAVNSDRHPLAFDALLGVVDVA